MVRRYIYTLLVVVASLLLSVGCSKKRQLSDAELAQVFHDAFLANAYTSKRGISLDSLRLYEPIFQSYGYTTEDVQYTIGSFSTRKSARLSDVVERAISMLEERGEELDREVDILKSLDQMAERRSIETIYRDSLVEYRAARDSSKMIVTIEEPRVGRYTLSFDYLIDSLDKTTKPYNSKSWLEQDKVESSNDSTYVRRFSESSIALKRNAVNTLERTINVSEEADRLVIELARRERENATPYVTIKSVKLTRTPDIEEAREITFQDIMNIHIFDDELLFR